ncbi:hypothetical protein PsorP6_001578 [Peronosclerospora sorghi]|uniref:Uncharacterized protein n=1 Tax=Peronosclerospora sorghi TaxID=230839 RepID=A0ACC0WVH8_9STRA|nr:hypothetical protein PsorP6_001578 [Peronosclerospora sorghi]
MKQHTLEFQQTYLKPKADLPLNRSGVPQVLREAVEELEDDDLLTHHTSWERSHDYGVLHFESQRKSWR